MCLKRAVCGQLFDKTINNSENRLFAVFDNWCHGNNSKTQNGHQSKIFEEAKSFVIFLMLYQNTDHKQHL